DQFNPEFNIKVGVSFFKSLVQRFNYIEFALAAYNAGPSRVREWLERYLVQDPLLFMDLVTFRKPRSYISSILINYYWYTRIGMQNKDFSVLPDYVSSNLVKNLILKTSEIEIHPSQFQ